MTVICTGYIVNASENWSRRADASATLKALVHAEKVVWRQLPASTAYLLVQDAYPCKDCHQYFKDESRRKNAIIIKVEANEGCYS